jgi:uncharacterized membrane protein
MLNNAILQRVEKIMKKTATIASALLMLVLALSVNGFAFWWGGKGETVTPENGAVAIPLADINDGKAHHFKVAASDGTEVNFFTLKSRDNVIRAAIDSCDVCYKSGKGYFQEDDFMVCENCGQKFASNRINVIKGGCNPAPLRRTVVGDKLVISMADIDTNRWYMKYRR